MLNRIRTGIRNKIFAGFLVVVPVFSALLVCWWLLSIVDRVITPVIRPMANAIGFPAPSFLINIFGIILLLLIFLIVGVISTNYFGKKLVQAGEWLAHRIPIFRNIYAAVKQVLETFAFMEKKAFQEAVIVEYPRPGVYSIAFVTNELENEMSSVIEDDLLTLFIPTAPNPTSGWVMMVPARDCIRVGIGVEEAMRFILSAGVVKLDPKQFKNLQEKVSSERRTAPVAPQNA